MKLLNIGCGATRPGEPWLNLDNLHETLRPGTPERNNLDAESNYINVDLSTVVTLPLPLDHFDGMLCSHVIEHFDCHEAIDILSALHFHLKPGGVFVASVPDADYFLSVYDRDTPERAQELFGEPICIAEPWHKSFFFYALLNNLHRQVLNKPSLTCLLLASGFERLKISDVEPAHPALLPIGPLINRRKFSAILYAVK